MAKIRAGCASCGEPLQPVGSGALRCPRCDAGISPPERQQPSGVQLAPRESAIQEPPQETRIQLQPGGSGQSSPGLLPRRAAVARSWWDAALASVFWSLVGIPAGAVAAATGFVVLMLSGAAGVGSSDGTGGAALVFIPALGAVVGFGVGFAVPLLRHAWKVRRAGQVVGIGRRLDRYPCRRPGRVSARIRPTALAPAALGRPMTRPFDQVNPDHASAID